MRKCICIKDHKGGDLIYDWNVCKGEIYSYELNELNNIMTTDIHRVFINKGDIISLFIPAKEFDEYFKDLGKLRTEKLMKISESCL
jgi:hypothetical protein